MADQPTNSLISLGDLAKPADTLIKKVSKAVGGIFEPYQIKRIAKAEAEAAVIKAQTEIQITELHRRAMRRFIEEEARKQENIESITTQAIPELKADADAGQMEDDWVTNFFDKSRIVSDQEMQTLWARVLSGEANKPGSFSKRTVNILSDIEKSDAELFTRLCGFGWNIGSITPLVFDLNAPVYANSGVSFSALIHLESIGLVQFDHLAGYVRRGLPKRFTVSYYGRPLPLEMQKDNENDLQIGHALLTRAGQELVSVCRSTPVDGFFEYVKAKWNVHAPKLVP